MAFCPSKVLITCPVLKSRLFPLHRLAPEKVGPLTTGVVVLSLRGFALKSPVPIKWFRPEKIPCYKPEKSGDLKPLGEIDLKEPPLELKRSKELETADENVKRLFSLEFAPYKKAVAVFRNQYMDLVRRHSCDKSSPEARVAKMTADIRDMQLRIEKHPHDKLLKVRLKETIDKRKKVLKQLREWDYKCYEWLLEKLNLFYKPQPPKTVYLRVERKRSLRMLTDSFCEDIVNKKLSEYRDKLEAEQEAFLLEKIERLKWIMKEEEECGVSPTVAESDINKAEEQLEMLRKNRAKPDVEVADS